MAREAKAVTDEPVHLERLDRTQHPPETPAFPQFSRPGISYEA